jgi:hypothetical protein
MNGTIASLQPWHYQAACCSAVSAIEETRVDKTTGPDKEPKPECSIVLKTVRNPKSLKKIADAHSTQAV